MTPRSNTAREYLRVSADKSGRERSPAEQHADNERAATGRKWRLGKPYKDVGSASRNARKRRDGFDRLIADLTADRFGAAILILWESSRGSRRVSEWCALIELCEERGVLIFVTSDGKLYDPADPRDRRSLLEDAVDAEYESAKISKRTTRAAAATAAAGRPHGRVPFGYRRTYDPTTGRLAAQRIEPGEAKVVRELFDRIHKGHSLRSIAADFDRRGVRTRSGKVFSQQHLRTLAVLRCYIGERVHDAHRTNGHKLSDTAVFTKATWPAIVTRPKFLAVQRRLTAPERVTTRPGRATHLLSMIARCDVCSGPLAARWRHDADTEYQEYTCHRSGHVRVMHDELDKFAELKMVGYLTQPDTVTRLTADTGNDAAVAAVREEIAGLRAELDDLADNVGAGNVSAMLAARAEPKILARLKAAEEREAELTRPTALRGLITPGKNVARQWKTAPMSARREVARLLLSPQYLGELRVTRATSPGHRRPLDERVVWLTSRPELAIEHVARHDTPVVQH